MDLTNHQAPNSSHDNQRCHVWSDDDIPVPASLQSRLLDSVKSASEHDLLLQRDELMKALRHPDWTRRVAAVQALGKSDDPSLLKQLQEALHDEHVSVRAAAVCALGQPGVSVPLHLLAHALQDVEWQVREKAVLVLATQGTPAALKLLEGALYDPDSMVREATSYALQQIQESVSQSVQVVSSVAQKSQVERTSMSLSDHRVKMFFGRLWSPRAGPKSQYQLQGETRMSVHKGHERAPAFTAAITFALVVTLVGVWVLVLHQYTLPRRVEGQTQTVVHPTVTPVPSPTVIPRKMAATIFTYQSSSNSIFSLSWSPNDQRIVMADTAIKSWDTLTGQNVMTYANQANDQVTSVVWSPDGRYIAGSGTFVQLWDATSGDGLGTFTPQVQGGKTPLANMDFIESAWSPDSSLLASLVIGPAYGQSLQVWNRQTRQVVFSIPLPNASKNPLNDVQWSPNGKYLALGEGEKILVYSVATRTLVSQNTGGAFAWSPDSASIASTDNCSSDVLIWNSLTGKTLSRIAYHDPISGCSAGDALAWSPDGKRIGISAFVIRAVALLDVSTGQVVLEDTKQIWNGGTGITSLGWSHTGKMIASSDGGETGPATLRVWTAG